MAEGPWGPEAGWADGESGEELAPGHTGKWGSLGPGGGGWFGKCRGLEVWDVRGELGQLGRAADHGVGSWGLIPSAKRTLARLHGDEWLGQISSSKRFLLPAP